MKEGAWESIKITGSIVLIGVVTYGPMIIPAVVVSCLTTNQIARAAAVMVGIVGWLLILEWPRLWKRR